MATVKRLSSEDRVVIFSKSTSCVSHSIIMLIRNFGANPTIYELDKLPNGQEIEKELLELGCSPSVPTVYIGKKLIGGANEVMSLNMKSELRPLLIKANAIWI